MDKKTSKKAGLALKKSVSLKPVYDDFIESEIRLQKEATGYTVTRSAVVESALKLLQKHREQVQAGIVKAEKAKEKIKREK
jgi:hypothetical protein